MLRTNLCSVNSPHQ